MECRSAQVSSKNGTPGWQLPPKCLTHSPVSHVILMTPAAIKLQPVRQSTLVSHFNHWTVGEINARSKNTWTMGGFGSWISSNIQHFCQAPVKHWVPQTVYACFQLANIAMGLVPMASNGMELGLCPSYPAKNIHSLYIAHCHLDVSNPWGYPPGINNFYIGFSTLKPPQADPEIAESSDTCHSSHPGKSRMTQTKVGWPNRGIRYLPGNGQHKTHLLISWGRYILSRNPMKYLECISDPWQYTLMFSTCW